jgi:hypothetical protein
MLYSLNGEWESAAEVGRVLLDHHLDRFDQAAVIFGGQLTWHLVDLERFEEAGEVASLILPKVLGDHRYMAWPPFIHLPEALALGDRRSQCEEVCTAAEEFGRKDAPVALAAAAIGRAALALADRQPERAVALLEGARPMVERFGPVLQARILRRLGHALRARGIEGGRTRGRAVLEECLSLLDRMGDRRMAGLVRKELEDVPPS